MSNTMSHVALEPGTNRMQDVILADVDANDFETIGTLLSTNVLISQIIESEQNGYLLIFDGEYERPYPSVMIWRIEISGEERRTYSLRIFFCPECHHYHRELPDFMIPYKHYSAETYAEIEQKISCYKIYI